MFVYKLCPTEGIRTPHFGDVCAACPAVASPPAAPTRSIYERWHDPAPDRMDTMTPVERFQMSIGDSAARFEFGALATIALLGLVAAAALYGLGKVIEIWVIDKIAWIIDYTFGGGGATFVRYYWGFWIALGVAGYLWGCYMVAMTMGRATPIRQLWIRLGVFTAAMALAIAVTSGFGFWFASILNL